MTRESSSSACSRGSAGGTLPTCMPTMKPAAKAMATMSQRVRTSATVSAAAAASRAARRRGAAASQAFPVHGDEREGEPAGHGLCLLERSRPPDRPGGACGRLTSSVWRLASKRGLLAPSVRAGTSPSAPVSSSETKTPKRVTPAMRPCELGARVLGEIGGAVAILRVALGGLRAPLGGRDVRGHGLQRRPRSLRPDATMARGRTPSIRARCTSRSA